jgi:hypothetical protein
MSLFPHQIGRKTSLLRISLFQLRRNEICVSLLQQSPLPIASSNEESHPSTAAMQPMWTQFKGSTSLPLEAFPTHLPQNQNPKKPLSGEMIPIATGRRSVDLRTVTAEIMIR